MASLKLRLLETTYDWCVECGLTPHVLIEVDSTVRVPLNYVENGRIVLNISPMACQGLLIDENGIEFSARFRGVAQTIYSPLQQVGGIFARETGEGVFFAPDGAPAAAKTSLSKPNSPDEKAQHPKPEFSGKDSSKKGRSFLRLIKEDEQPDQPLD